MLLRAGQAKLCHTQSMMDSRKCDIAQYCIPRRQVTTMDRLALFGDAQWARLDLPLGIEVLLQAAAKAVRTANIEAKYL